MRSEAEIQEVLDNLDADATAGGASKLFGMNYEQGADDMGRWVLGQTDEKPGDE